MFQVCEVNTQTSGIDITPSETGFGGFRYLRDEYPVIRPVRSTLFFPLLLAGMPISNPEVFSLSDADDGIMQEFVQDLAELSKATHPARSATADR
jgi:hypothetical protein